MYRVDYLEQIRNARNRFEAATLVRANAAYLAARLYGYSDSDRLSIVESAERLAETLERDYSLDGDTPCPESQHPWKQWLVEAGYVEPERVFYSDPPSNTVVHDPVVVPEDNTAMLPFSPGGTYGVSQLGDMINNLLFLTDVSWYGCGGVRDRRGAIDNAVVIMYGPVLKHDEED